MKVYNWNELWTTLFLVGMFTWMGVRTYSENRLLPLVEIACAVFILVRGLWCALTERGDRWGREQARLSKLAMERRFGRFKNVVLWGGLVLLGVPALLSLLWIEFILLVLLMFGFVVLYYVAVLAMIKAAKDEIRAEEAAARGEGKAV